MPAYPCTRRTLSKQRRSAVVRKSQIDVGAAYFYEAPSCVTFFVAIARSCRTSRRFGLQGFDIAEQGSFMPLWIYLLVDPANDALGVDHKTRALPELHSLPLRLADAEGLHQFGVRVGKQIDGKRKLCVEVLVRGHVVGANANDFDSGGIEISLGRG